LGLETWFENGTAGVLLNLCFEISVEKLAILKARELWQA
jgi:hypothetical protein